MKYIEILLLTFSIFTSLIDLSLIFLFFITAKAKKKYAGHFPHISILVAARNEEKLIAGCIQSILNLDYPKEKIQILIGNDNSDDKTKEIIQGFQKFDPRIELYDITQTVANTKGKANVLAQLTKKASAGLYFFTDADIILPKHWINGMLAEYDSNVGIITGVTIVKGNSLWARLQSVDWTFALAMAKVITDIGKPIMTMGNNMMITKEAYDSIGGYESIPFSVTEDYELFVHVQKKGYEVKNIFNPDVKAFTFPAPSLKNWVQQRKRWMVGAWRLPPIMLLILFTKSTYFASLFLLLYISPTVAIWLFLIKIVIQSIFIYLNLKRLQQQSDWKYLIPYEFYSGLLSLILLIVYALPGKIKWKGREYEK